jgi:ElaB/YqjD/DUF883 family membrane-anchored ribosome-binding protein
MADTGSTYYDEATTQPQDNADVAAQVRSLRQQIADLAQEATEQAAEGGEAGAEFVRDAVGKNPYAAIGIALVAGIGIGMALKR